MTQRRRRLIHSALEKLIRPEKLSPFETRSEIVDWLRSEVSPRELASVLEEDFDWFEMAALDSIISGTPPCSADLSKKMLDRILRVFGPYARRRAPEGGTLN